MTNIAENEFKNNRIRTFLNEADLDTALKSLYRSAKVSMEENGSNTLSSLWDFSAGMKATFPKSHAMPLWCLSL